MMPSNDTFKMRLTAAERKKKQKQQRIIRAVIQVVFFISMPGAFVAGFSGVKYLFLWIGSGQVLQLSSFVKALIGLCIFTILFGRYFCGFVCAFGSIGDLIYELSALFQKKVLKKKKVFGFPKKWLQVLQKVKYVNLAVILVLCAFGIYNSLKGTSCWDVFSFLTAGRLQFAGYGIGLASLGLVVIGMALQERFFCQFLCPMGAVFALLPVLPWTSLKRQSKKCLPNCRGCRMQCPVDLKLDEGIRDGECIACEKCTFVCHMHHIRQPLDHWSLMIIKAVLFFAMGVYLGFCRFF